MEHAQFVSQLSSESQPSTAEYGPAPVEASQDMYASIMSKESNVLDLIRRVDDTKRETALKSVDRITPLFTAFLSGMSSFITRLIHYTSTGSARESVALVTSPDGMLFTGVIIVVISVVLALI